MIPITIGNFVYDTNGQVVDYGTPNGTFLYRIAPDSTGGPLVLFAECRPCWYFYDVTVFYMNGSI